MLGLPVKLIFKIPAPPFVNVPVPARAVETVSVPLFVYDPLTVTDAMEIVPLNVWVDPLNV